MNPIDGGPAFPIGSGDMRDPFGMTLRDYFAAKAMQGLLAQLPGIALKSDPILGAQYAYRVADAMLAVRRETKR
jgi:hypothetical protein